MKILPLAATKPDWEAYIKTVSEVLGFSPSSGLGETYIKIESPAAYLATLDLANHPLHQLRQGNFINSTFEHFSVSFICAIDAELTTTLLQKFPNLSFLVTKGKKSYLIIATATMASWYIAVRRGLSVNQDSEIREFFHSIYEWFCALGFQDVWFDLEKSEGKDGFIVLGASF